MHPKEICVPAEDPVRDDLLDRREPVTVQRSEEIE